MKTDLEVLIQHLVGMDWADQYAIHEDFEIEVAVMDIVEGGVDNLDNAMAEADELGLEIDPDDLQGFFFYVRNADGVVHVKKYETQREANKKFVEFKNFVSDLV